MKIKKVLVTGGLGYIGSHTIVELVNKGYEPIIIDNLSNASIKVLDVLEQMLKVKIPFYQIDCTDSCEVNKVFDEHEIDAVIHFAALKAVGESIQKPAEYYYNNLVSTLTILKAVQAHGVKNFIFSSSATVYGNPIHVPCLESDPIVNATNPYGQTKIINERILTDYSNIHKDTNIALLRYANPIGAHPSGKLGENPNGIPNNLMPYVSQVAVGKRDKLTVFGNDYPTKDGTCIRDYIHVSDLALGHVLTLEKFETNPGLVIYNLGTGEGTSVLDLVNAYQKATGIKINYTFGPRRDGDIPTNYLDVTKAKNELGFKCKYSIEDCCKTAYEFQIKHPNGY